MKRRLLSLFAVVAIALGACTPSQPEQDGRRRPFEPRARQEQQVSPHLSPHLRGGVTDPDKVKRAGLLGAISGTSNGWTLCGSQSFPILCGQRDATHPRAVLAAKILAWSTQKQSRYGAWLATLPD